MSALPSIPAINTMVQSYIDNGWKLCAVTGKKPTHPAWNKRENALTAPPTDGQGVGLMHAFSGTCSLDLDDLQKADSWLASHGVSVRELLSAADSVEIVSGVEGHRKLLYALPFPLPSKKIHVDGVVAFELRCATVNGDSTQCVLPSASVHPSTMRNYRWGGNGSWKNLPLVPDAILAVWHQLLQKDSQRNVPMGASVSASMDEVRSAVHSIPADCDRKKWIDVGMALQVIGQATGQPDNCFQLWNEWSATCETKYPGARETFKQWQSFKPVEKGITAASLFHHAYNSGWKRPVEDVSSMFLPVKEKTVEEVKHLVSPGARIPKCDYSLWPELLLDRATEVSVEVGCDPIVPLMAGLCAISCAVDKRSKLVLNETWRVSPTIWAMTIGEPADKKTPGSKPMFVPLHMLEKEDVPRYEAEMMAWQGKESRYASQMKAYREFAADPSSEMGNTEPPPVEALPPQPERLRLLLNDATTQKVVNLAQWRPKGFLLWLDEMNNWFRKIGDSRGTDDRGCWIQGYETGAYTMDRMGAGSIHVENFALSIFGNCQPQVFRKHVTESSMDGLLQRFLPVVLDPSRNALWETGRPSFMSHANEYEQLIRRTHALPVFEYVLCDEAMQLFRGFCSWAITLRENERIIHSSTSYITALGKLEGNCSRLMLLFHIILDPYCPVVTEDTARRAIGLMRKFFYQMLRYTFMVVGQERDEVGQAVVDAVIQCATAKTVISMSELRRMTKKASGHDAYNFQNDQMIRATVEELIAEGWMNYLQDHPRQPTFVINPELATVYKEHRQKVIEAKQMVIEAIEEDMTQRTGRPVKINHTAIGYEAGNKIPL